MIISFDFDDTLTMPVNRDGLWGSSLLPNRDTIREMRRLSDEGHRIIIVTSRFKSTEPQEFVDAHNLPVEDIFFTEGKFKALTLKGMEVDHHFDDGFMEIDQCVHHGVDCTLVLHPLDAQTEKLSNVETNIMITEAVKKS